MPERNITGLAVCAQKNWDVIFRAWHSASKKSGTLYYVPGTIRVKLHNYLAEMAIILYLGFLIGLISNLEKLGQSDLNEKRNIHQFVKNVFKLLINHQVDFRKKKFRLDAPLRRFI